MAEKLNHNPQQGSDFKGGNIENCGFLLGIEPRTSCMLGKLASTERLPKLENTSVVRLTRKREHWDSTGQIMSGIRTLLQWDSGSKGNG